MPEAHADKTILFIIIIILSIHRNLGARKVPGKFLISFFSMF